MKEGSRIVTEMKVATLVAVAALVSLFFQGCLRGSDERRQLAHAEQLLRSDSPAQARAVLDSIDASSLNNDDYAWRSLLDLQTSYKLYEPVPPDSSISVCVDYWKERGNSSRHCLALCYRGLTRFSAGNLEGAAIDLKNAESLADHSGDLYLKNRVYSSLAAVNYTSGIDTLTLYYARKELATGREAGDKGWILYAYNHLACAYDMMRRPDSVTKYIAAVIPLLDSVPPDSRAPHLSNVGSYYLQKGDTAKALEFGWRSREARHISSNANLLAGIYFNKGDTARAAQIWKEADREGSLDDRIQIASSMARHYYERGYFQESGEINIRLNALKDSLFAQDKTIKLQQLQLDYDHAEKMQQSRRSIWILAIVFSVIILLAAVIFLLARRRYVSRILNASKAVEDSERRIESLEDMIDSHDKKIKSLRRKMQMEADRQSDTITRGKVLYETIRGGATTINWSKEQFRDFLAYYKVLNPELFEKMDAEYTRLSAGNRFMLALWDMGLDNTEVARILCISAGSLRSARSRLKAKRLPS